MTAIGGGVERLVFDLRMPDLRERCPIPGGERDIFSADQLDVQLVAVRSALTNVNPSYLVSSDPKSGLSHFVTPLIRTDGSVIGTNTTDHRLSARRVDVRMWTFV
jgi:hypothetical protein